MKLSQLKPHPRLYATAENLDRLQLAPETPLLQSAWQRMQEIAEQRCHRSLWNDITQQMAGVGMNMLVIDLGEGVRYESLSRTGGRKRLDAAGTPRRAR